MSNPTIVNLSGYRFVHLADLPAIQADMKEALAGIGIKGSVMLASEGVNLSLAGTVEQVDQLRAYLDRDERFSAIWLKESMSLTVPFPRLRIRVRTEIIAFDGQDSESLQASRPSAPSIAPEILRDWLEQKREITLLDARNDYEIVSGTFTGSRQLGIKHFRNFKTAVLNAVEDGSLDPKKPLVTYCTGGIRCEKAAPWLLENGFNEVYQVEGGVIHYLQQCGDAFWQGDCFVFDNRVEVNSDLVPTGAGLCDDCQLAVPAGTQCRCQLGKH
ncbi:MAG: rhodanese-like domain-containing protein [Granulosicoccus sp.]